MKQQINENICLKPIEDDDCLLSLQEFVKGVSSTCFTDYDGYGVLANQKGKTDITIIPSKLYDSEIVDSIKNSEYTHVVWYNK